MLPSLFNNSALESLEQTVEFSTRRHSVLAGNIANMDTPGYQTRDLPVKNFQESLKDLSEAKRKIAQGAPAHTWETVSGNEPQLAHYREDLLAAKNEASEHVYDSMRQVVYHDGSDDNLEVQVLEMSKNQTMHNMAIALLRSQFQTLKVAISESVNV